LLPLRRHQGPPAKFEAAPRPPFHPYGSPRESRARGRCRSPALQGGPWRRHDENSGEGRNLGRSYAPSPDVLDDLIVQHWNGMSWRLFCAGREGCGRRPPDSLSHGAMFLLRQIKGFSISIILPNNSRFSWHVKCYGYRGARLFSRQVQKSTLDSKRWAP